MLIKQIQKVGNRGARSKKQCSFGHDSFSPWDIPVLRTHSCNNKVISDSALKNVDP